VGVEQWLGSRAGGLVQTPQLVISMNW